MVLTALPLIWETESKAKVSGQGGTTENPSPVCDPSPGKQDLREFERDVSNIIFSFLLL